MKKILFGITGLTLGGAERVLVDTANALVDKYDITIFTIYAKGEFEKELNPKIKLKSLYNKRYDELSSKEKKLIPLKILFNKKSIYKKYIKLSEKDDYDSEIAFLEGPITRLFSVKNINVKKIVWVHNDIEKVFGGGFKAKIKEMVDESVYKKYNKIVFVSDDNKKQFEKVYRNVNVHKDVAYNYIDVNKVVEKSNKDLSEKEQSELDKLFNNDAVNFVTVARLVKQKGIDRLVRVHKKLIDVGYKHNIYIIGDGPEREYIEELIKENHVEKTFKLLGKKSNPYTYMKQADAFCLLSYFEGYGMVLEEAKALGEYILITNTAAREAVKGYDKGKCLIVANSEFSIYDGLAKYITNIQKIKMTVEEVNKVMNEEDKKYDNKVILDKIIKIIG